MAMPSPAQIEYMEIHIKDNRQTGIIVAIVICTVTAYVAVALRFIARHLARLGLQADDWWILAGLAFTTAVVVSFSLSVQYGMGRHAILISSIEGFAQTAISGECLYSSSILCIKLSILYLYRRIFPQRWFRDALLVTGALVVGYSVAAIFVNILQCIPLSTLWDLAVKGKCVDYKSVIIALGVINIVTDCIMLALPLPILWRLQVSTTQKWLLSATFLLGGFVCVISVVRLFYINQVFPTDPSWDDVDGAILSLLEPCVGIVAACLPACRSLFNYLRNGTARAGSRKSGSKGSKTVSQPNQQKPVRLSAGNKSWVKSKLQRDGDDEENLYTVLR